MNKIAVFVIFTLLALHSKAQQVKFVWPLCDHTKLDSCVVEGADSDLSCLTKRFVKGASVSAYATMSESVADADYTPVSYSPAFTQFTHSSDVSTITAGHNVSCAITVKAGHTFKLSRISYDAAKCGTDNGSVGVSYKIGTESPVTVSSGDSPLRNKISATNSVGYSSFVHDLNKIYVEGKTLYVNLYIQNITANTKQMAFRNLIVEGTVDEKIYTLSDYITSFSWMQDGSLIEMFNAVKDMRDGDTQYHAYRLTSEPTDFQVSAVDGYTAEVKYVNEVATISIQQEGKTVFSCRYIVRVDMHKPLNRGLIAPKVASGVFVNWRMRSYDIPGETQYKLYRGSDLITTLKSKTNYLDSKGKVGTIYTLEVCDAEGNVLESQTEKAWSNQYLAIPLAAAPTDTKGTGATYTPNDAQTYDMDGDGEQEIVFRWEPSNVKDAASNGVTGAVWLECIKLDGTQLWRINLGQNIWASQHTVSFLCYDFDGDGRGELICKTAPGTIDGEGNYVLLAGDDAKANYGNNDKPTSGPEYVTVFEGKTGKELSTINYWPAYKDGKSYGDSKKNRSFRFNTTLARLDVNGVPTHCAVLNRGYYAQAYYQAVTFDGTDLKQLWRAEFTTSGKGMYSEGYHTLQSADVDNDGFDEIIVGSAVMDHDGKALWRTGDGHGDALHVGDFDWDNEGLEIYSVKESKTGTYTQTLRDARTGKLLWGTNRTESVDTGRGLIGDFDDKHEGAECFCSSNENMFDSKGKAITPWHVGTTSSSSINFRIYWDGDLYDEYHDRSHFDKWSSSGLSWGTTSFRYNIGPGCSTINGTKYVPNLQADIFGDWREEVIYWYSIDESKGLYGLNLITTGDATSYALPYLRDDPVYDNAIAWQNTTYNQPPHLGFSPTRNLKLYGKPWIASKEAAIQNVVRCNEEVSARYDLNGRITQAQGLSVKAGRIIFMK